MYNKDCQATGTLEVCTCILAYLGPIAMLRQVPYLNLNGATLHFD
jgi:hypothetical protein